MKAKSGILTWLPPIVSLGLFAVAIWVLHGMIQGLDLEDVLREFRSISAYAVGTSIIVMIVSYFVLMSYDVLAISHIGRKLPYGKVLLAAFVGYVFSHNIGMSLVTGGGVRYRVYTAAGLSAFEIGAVTLLCGLTFTLGAMVIGGIALIFEPADLFSPIGISHDAARFLGTALLIAVVAWVIWAGTRKHEIKLREFTMRAPGFGLSLKQIVVAILEITLSGLTLYVLMPKGYDLSFVVFIAVYVLATVGGILSHVPGGIGVIEATFLLLLPQIPQGPMLASILAFRVIYLIIPLFVGAMLLGLFEVTQQRHAMKRMTAWAGTIADRLVPAAVGSAVMVGAAFLLFSGARPILPWRLEWLAANIPLAAIEAAHIAATLAAFGLLMLARPLFARLASAHRLAVILLGVAAIAAIVKGLEFEEATVIATVLAVLLLSQPAFRRSGSILDQRYTAAWIVSIAVVIGAYVWLGLFSFKEQAFSGSVWWSFAFDGEAARFIRSTGAIVLAIVAVILARRTRAAPGIPAPADAGTLAEAERIRLRAPGIGAAPLRTDLRYYVDPAGDAYICFDIRRRSWIALGDPVGRPEALSAIIWNFRDLCESHAGEPVFAATSENVLPHFADLGLRPHVLGEEAIVPLRAGGGRADAPAAAPGPAIPAAVDIPFAVAKAGAIPNLDALLAYGNGNAGSRPEADVRCATIVSGGTVLAFAPLHDGDAPDALRLGRVHAVSGAPAQAFTALLSGAVRWAHDQGFATIGLGFAPPRDPSPAHPLRPLWDRAESLLFPNARHVGGSAALRRSLEAFAPAWRPRYLVAARGPHLVMAIEDVIAWVESRPQADPLLLS